jgi:Gram-negative bacterial TonB protein C-terminal
MAFVSGLSRTIFATGTLAVVALMVSSAPTAQQAFKFIPPRISNVVMPTDPPMTVPSGGEVLIEAIVSQSGALTRPVLLRSTPPYAQFMLEAIVRWRFLPARASSPNVPEAPVDAPVLIAAVYRPPTFYNNPTVGEAPKDLAAPSVGVAFPAALIAPPYPPNAANAATVFSVLFEVFIDQTGQMTEARPVATDPGFESAARDTLALWKFSPALFRGRPVATTAYVLFGLRPIVVVPMAPEDPKKPKPVPRR